MYIQHTCVCVCEAIPMHTLHPMSSLIKLLSDQPVQSGKSPTFFFFVRNETMGIMSSHVLPSTWAPFFKTASSLIRTVHQPSLA